MKEVVNEFLEFHSRSLVSCGKPTLSQKLRMIKICCSLCLCMACAVLSSVSLVYLTFIVYIPAKREITSGLLDLPVICTTTHMRETDQCE